MTLFHAVVWIDHEKAQVLQFSADEVQATRVKAHTHPTAQHGSDVRSQHEFYAAVCDALQGVSEVLAVGPKNGVSDFEHYVNKHRPQTAQQIVGHLTADHPTDNQLVALARQFFVKFDRMAGTPIPS